MQFIKQLFVIFLLTAFANYLLPWWSVALVGFLVAYYMGEKAFPSFLAGFVGVFFIWFAYAFYIDVQNNHILSLKIIQLFKLPNPLSLILVGACIGAITAGFASLSGFYLKKIMA